MKTTTKANAKKTVAKWTAGYRAETMEIFQAAQEKTGKIGMEAVKTLPPGTRERVATFLLGWM